MMGKKKSGATKIKEKAKDKVSDLADDLGVTKTKSHSKKKAVLAAGAVTVAATTAYRRHSARGNVGNARQPNPMQP